MSVEAGPSGAIGVTGPASLAGTVPVATGEFSTIVIDGPVSLEALENTMPMTLSKFNPVGEIVFRPSGPSVIEQAEAVAAAAWETTALPTPQEEAQNPLTEKGAVAKVEPWLGTRAETVIIPHEPRVIPMTAPRLEAQPQPVVVASPKTESKRANAQTVSRSFPQEQIMEVTEEKKTVAQENKEQGNNAKESEEQSLKKVKLVEAVHVSERRRWTLKAAVKKAAEGGERLTLRLIRKFLTWTREDLSPIVRHKGADGTLSLIDQALESETVEYSSKEAEKKSVGLVEKYRPVEKGEGDPVTMGEVRQVLEGKEAKRAGVNMAAEIVARRVVRKSEVLRGEAVTTVEEKVEINTETSLKDFPELAEVFPP